jgi:hypothetical protein
VKFRAEQIRIPTDEDQDFVSYRAGRIGICSRMWIRIDEIFRKRLLSDFLKHSSTLLSDTWAGPWTLQILQMPLDTTGTRSLVRFLSVQKRCIDASVSHPPWQIPCKAWWMVDYNLSAAFASDSAPALAPYPPNSVTPNQTPKSGAEKNVSPWFGYGTTDATTVQQAVSTGSWPWFGLVWLQADVDTSLPCRA